MPPPDSGRVPAVLLLSDLLDLGGAETQLLQMAARLRGGRLEPRLGVLRDRRVRAVEGSGIETEDLTRFGMRFPGDPAALRRLAAFLRSDSIRLVYASHAWSQVFAALLGRRAVFVAAEHGFRVSAARPWLEPWRRAALRRAAAVVAVSEVQADWIARDLGVRRERIAVIPNAVDVDRHAFRSPRRSDGGASTTTRPVILSVARLVPEKDHATFLHAMTQLDAEAVLVGDGPLRRVLEAKTNALGLRERVRFAGEQSDPRPFYDRADLFCLSSTSESQGIAVLEAMASGVPVVATRVGGIPEVVEHDVSGLLVPRSDPTALADALRRLLDAPALAERLAEGARARVVERFSWTRRVERLEDLFLQLIAMRGGERA